MSTFAAQFELDQLRAKSAKELATLDARVMAIVERELQQGTKLSELLEEMRILQAAIARLEVMIQLGARK